MSLANSIPPIIPSSSSSTLTSPIICENINDNAPNYKQDNQQLNNLSKNSGTCVTNAKEGVSISSGKQPLKSYCILTPCSNSHPFEERKILVTRSEENSVKIGRSIVRLQPAHNNAIFDCKVLSRNHASLWMNDEGHFFIKDTRSSNGTFINNERLSPSGEESEPKELYSGDILQLGVEIVDNTKKVASGCVTCIIRLTNEKGEEYADRPQSDSFAFPIRNENQIPLNYTLVRNDKLFIFEQYIKEAKHRETLLGQRLQTIEGQLLTAQEQLQTKWDEHINQELLLSRIELLESQLTYLNTKNATTNKNAQTTSSNAIETKDEIENELKREIRELIEDRAKTEQLAKDSLRKKCEEMQEAAMRLNDVETGLRNVEEECSFLRQRCADYDLQLNKQRDNYDTLMLKYNEVCSQLVAVEKAVASAENSSPPRLENGGDVSSPLSINESSPKNEIVKEVSQNICDEVATSETKSNEELPKTVDNVNVQELLNKLSETEYQLSQLKEHKLNETNERIERVTISTDQSSPADFQIFLLSIFPFLIILLMFLAPLFYFVSPWTTNIAQSVDNEQLAKVNSEQEDLLINVKEEE